MLSRVTPQADIDNYMDHIIVVEDKVSVDFLNKHLARYRFI